jgi:hypothetical protein
MYSHAIQELQNAGLFIEATHVAIALNEIGLLPTKQDIYQALRGSNEAVLRSDRDCLNDAF